MTPAYAKISEDAYQKGGIKPVVPGTVTQIEFLKKNHEGKTYLSSYEESIRYSMMLRLAKNDVNSTKRESNGLLPAKICKVSS